ncbi:Ogd [Scenedesmus sp. PABB004]|nr:Ogd [Scenedesmus sp. PABB004]
MWPDLEKRAEAVLAAAEAATAAAEAAHAALEPPWDGYCGLVRVADDEELKERGVIRAVVRTAPPPEPKQEQHAQQHLPLQPPAEQQQQQQQPQQQQSQQSQQQQSQQQHQQQLQQQSQPPNHHAQPAPPDLVSALAGLALGDGSDADDSDGAGAPSGPSWVASYLAPPEEGSGSEAGDAPGGGGGGGSSSGGLPGGASQQQREQEAAEEAARVDTLLRAVLAEAEEEVRREAEPAGGPLNAGEPLRLQAAAAAAAAHAEAEAAAAPRAPDAEQSLALAAAGAGAVGDLISLGSSGGGSPTAGGEVAELLAAAADAAALDAALGHLGGGLDAAAARPLGGSEADGSSGSGGSSSGGSSDGASSCDSDGEAWADELPDAPSHAAVPPREQRCRSTGAPPRARAEQDARRHGRRRRRRAGPKRPRREPGADPTAGVIAPGLLDEGGRAALRAAHDGAAPYTHLVLRGLADEALLRRVRDEVISNVAATYKETDLFKVFQTGDLANLDALDPDSAAKLPNLLALRDAIYSTTFRKFIEDVTGVGGLDDKTDLSCNVYAQGGHLLNHDDVIGTRAVSFIIYLTDPDNPWTAADGGALELYPLVEGKPHTPDVTPTTSLLPHWNSMALFVVQPGRSFHSVQEVVSADKPRFSISGWYHKAAPQAGAQHASLQQLQMRAGEDALQGHAEFEGGPTGAELSDADLALLRRWINPAYLKPESWAKVGAAMEADGSVQLQRFLAADVAAQIAAATAAADAAQGVGGGAIPPFDAGCSDGWEAVGPPHKQRYLRYAGPPRTPGAAAAANGGADGGAAKAANGAAGADATGPGALLAGVRSELFESGAFARLLRAMLGVDVLRHAGEVRRFRAGLDYTVAHYGIITSAPRLDCVLSFVDDAGGGDAAQGWAVGEVGGFEAYLLADDEEEGAGGAAAVYRQDGNDSAVINVPAACNTLNLLMRDAGLMRFVKYVSAAAPGSRWDVAMEYVPEDDGVDPPLPDSPEGGGAEGADGGEAAEPGAGDAALQRATADTYLTPDVRFTHILGDAKARRVPPRPMRRCLRLVSPPPPPQGREAVYGVYRAAVTGLNYRLRFIDAVLGRDERSAAVVVDLNLRLPPLWLRRYHLPTVVLLKLRRGDDGLLRICEQVDHHSVLTVMWALGWPVSPVFDDIVRPAGGWLLSRTGWAVDAAADALRELTAPALAALPAWAARWVAAPARGGSGEPATAGRQLDGAATGAGAAPAKDEADTWLQDLQRLAPAPPDNGEAGSSMSQQRAQYWSVS